MWDPQDPRSKSPVPGEVGHFGHHEWLKEGLLEMHNQLAALGAAVAALEKALIPPKVVPVPDKKAKP
jgi:hypothetical protein